MAPSRGAGNVWWTAEQSMAIFWKVRGGDGEVVLGTSVAGPLGGGLVSVPTDC